MRRVAIYARVSTEHEAQISALSNQIQYYDDILKQHPDWELYDKYIDEGITGTSIHKRPNFLRMLEDAERHRFDLIVTREVSRFARNTVDTLQQTRELKKMGVEVYFTEDNIWTFKDDDGELKLTIMATLAQNESKKISQRVKAGQKITFQNGVFYGTGNILGYDKVGKDMVINPEQAKTVKFIFDSYLKGVKTRQIQYELERRGYKTATGRSNWSVQQILSVLKNPFYCGTIVYRKYFIPDYLEQKPKKNCGEVEQTIVEGKHIPIVTKDEFEQAQLLIAKHCTRHDNKTSHAGKLPKSVWQYKLECKCGSSMQKVKNHKTKSGYISYCYQCYKQARTGSYSSRLKAGLSVEGICDTKMITEWKLKLIAYVVFDRILSEREQIIDTINELLDKSIKSAESNKDINSELDMYKRRLEDLKKKSKKLLDTFLNELISQEDFANKKNEYDEEIVKTQNMINELKKDDDIPVQTLEEKIKELKGIILNNFNYKSGDMSDEMVESFVNKIIISNDLIEWHMDFISDKIINKKREREEILIAELAITDDDAINYSQYWEEFKRITIKEPIKVAIFI